MKQENITAKAVNTLKEIKQSGHNEVIVSYSGGKDSLAVLDMACRVFDKVVCFFMYFIPNLKCCEDQLQFARDRYGVQIVQYPHWILTKALSGAVYCDPSFKLDKLPQLKLYDIYRWALQDTGLKKILTGAKRTDSMWRRHNLGAIERGEWNETVVNPIVDWNKYDVLAYLRTHDIPIPPSEKGTATGIDLAMPSLLWLHDTFPDDFEKLLRVFPYAMAVIKRREFYGIES